MLKIMGRINKTYFVIIFVIVCDYNVSTQDFGSGFIDPG